MKVFLILFASAIMISAVFAQDINIGARMDSVLSDYNSPRVPGAAVMIIRNGNIIFEKAYGMANLEEKIPVSLHTNFRLASVTKEFTAQAVLMLVNEGRLSLDEKLTDIFPGFPAYGRKIKVINLLDHTSGLIAYEDLISDTATIQVKDKDVLNMMMGQDSTYFEPGSQYRYSNTGYAVLAEIVEKISGQHFDDFLKEHIFDPLGMKNSVAYEKGVSVVADRAYGYSRTDSGFVRTDQSITSAVLGDGGIYTSAADMFKWDQSLYTSKLLPQKVIRQSFTRNTLNSGEKFDYGFGWHLKTFLNREIVYHTGVTMGFRNVIYRIPSEHFTVIVLTNRNEGDTETLAEKIVKLFIN